MLNDLSVAPCIGRHGLQDSRHSLPGERLGDGEQRSKKRPSMFFATASIARLDMVLRGCSLARREVGVAPTNAEKGFENFQLWIQEKYGITSNQS